VCRASTELSLVHSSSVVSDSPVAISSATVEAGRQRRANPERRATSDDFYIIPTGGAGSFGSPPLESGIRIISTANATMTAIPARYEGC